METDKIKNYPSIQDSVPFSGIFSKEQIRVGHKLFLASVRKDKEQALKNAAQKSNATKYKRKVIID
jgi:hypothetical protein